MTEQVFLNFESFKQLVAEKRQNCTAMDDINMMSFPAIVFDSLSDEYLCKVRLKREYLANYKPCKELVTMENTHLIHWAEWLDIGVIVKKHPNLTDKMMLVTNVIIRLNEPCFIDQPMLYCIKILYEKLKKDKAEFSFLNTINQWCIINVDFVLMDEEINVLKYYYQKHG